jgi:hypothetical protein
VNDLCAPHRGGTCEEDVRLEVIQGRDTSPLVDVPRARSIESRLMSLISLLARRAPAEGWQTFLDGDRLHWDRVAVGGHSQGGGHAAMLGKLHGLDRVLLFSATESASWTRHRSSTPAERHWGFAHQQEANHPVFLQSWAALGITGPVQDVDARPPVAGGPKQLHTAAVPRVGGSMGLHGAVVVDAVTPLARDGRTPLFRPIWEAMLTLP